MMLLTFVLLGGCDYWRILSMVKRFKIKAPSKVKQSIIYMYDLSGTFPNVFLLSFFSVFIGVDKLKKL